MSSSSAYSLQLPFLGTIPLGRSPPNLASFQKPLRELYIPYYRQRRERHHDERRIIISDRDILIFEPDAVSKGKRSLIYATFESIVEIQALELYLMFNPTENHHYKRVRAAFLPIGCEHQERFRSLYSTIDKTQFNLLSTPSSTSCHPPLLLFVMRKSGTTGTGSLLDCHVFAVRRESTAFDLCDMIRKLIIKRTMSPISSTQQQRPTPPLQPPPSSLPPSSSSTTTTTTTLLRLRDNSKDGTDQRRTKYLDRDRPISAMEHRQADIPINIDMKMNRSISNTNLHDAINLSSNSLANPLSSTSFPLNNNNNNNQQANPYHDASQVLNADNDIYRMSSSRSTPVRTLSTKTQQQQQRHFIKASSSSSSTAVDESDEVVNDLMNIVDAEKLKTIDTNVVQVPIKRHASFDRTSSSSSNDPNGNTMNKKRYQHHNNNKKRSLFANSIPLPTIVSANNTPVISRTTTNVEQQQQQQQQQQQSATSILDSYLLRPQVVINRYGDIGNYVPKLLRENITTATASMRSSDSNENIFFRATNGHILNGFLNLDFSSKSEVNTKNPNRNNNNNNNNDNNSHYQSSPCLNEEIQERSVLSIVRQLKTNQTKSNSHERDSSMPNQTTRIENIENNHYVSSCQIPRVQTQQSQQPTKPIPAAMGGIKVLPFAPPSSYSSQRPLKTSYSSASSAKPRRVASFTVADTELPIDYRQYLRHTDKGAQLYGQEKQEPSETLEHSLGYLP
ncbi:unnamed protein product [Rotaria magnacalcarata]|nr:unnamed protein product [Rotaria magnacalcarata]